MSLLLDLSPELDHYETQFLLDGTAFDFVFRWNDRDQLWYFSIFDPAVAPATDGSRVPILGGLPIHVGWPMLNQFRTRTRPLGELLAIDTTGQDLDPGRRDLGQRVKLFYLTRGEIEAVTR